MMELILKPTVACNFNCAFCSAHGLKIKHDPKNIPPQIVELIGRLRPQRLIVTGGEPLMMDPEYYYKLHECAGVWMSLTTNLKDFYINPEKWAPLFREKWIGVGTSFQYGDKRMWDNDTVYTESMFRDVVAKFTEYTGKGAPPFIATIDWDNYDQCIKHVELAKELGTKVKLNNVLGMGSQKTTFPRYKMFQVYRELFKSDLWMYETNCLERRASKCPCVINAPCSETIRCAYVDTNDKLHLGICDDMVSLGIEIDPSTDCPAMHHPDDLRDLISDECVYCEMFRLCNRCNSQRKFAKEDPNYCAEMKKLESFFKEVDWLL